MFNTLDLKKYIKSNNEVTFIDIAKYFNVPISRNRDLTTHLNSLIKSGVIMQNSRKNYYIPIVIKTIKSKIKINSRGFGFVDISENESVFIAANNINGAMNDDEVEIIVMKDSIKKNSLVGSVIKIIERKNKFLFGSIKKNNEFFDFIPIDTKIKNKFRFVDNKSLEENTFVKVQIIDIKNDCLFLKVIKIISKIDQPYADINLILESMEIDDKFNSNVMEEVKLIPSEVKNITEFDRIDLRTKNIVTIDGVSTKDFDDAINVEKLENGNFKLGVYIADVAYYVKEDSAIDKQAFSRATSIYLIDKVIPMLPEALSNGICSLNPNVDRFVLALESEIDKYGKAINPKIFPAVINSKYRLTYDQVENKENDSIINKDPQLKIMLNEAYELSKILSEKKKNDGYIDFEIEEAIIELDEKGKTKKILTKKRKSSEILIENFMVFANEVVAKIISDLKVSNIYRIHEFPSPEKIKSFQDIVNILKIDVKIPDNGKPKSFQESVNKIKEVRFDDLIKMSLLRTMQKAKYDSNNIGHFGLASEFYSHFTSPIRRYPDLALHRIIWEIIIKKNKKYIDEIAQKIDLICSQSSKQEELAVSIERKIFDVKKSEFYESKIGTIQEGVIISIKKFGMFVDFKDKVCCFVHITNIPNGPYNISNNELQLYNDVKKYTVGDTVFIKIIAVSKLEGKIDGAIVNQ